MKKNQYSDLLLDQSNDHIWVVDCNLILVYANKAYLNLIKEVTGVEKHLNTPVLMEGFGEGVIEKWKSYYQRALSGEYLDIEEDFYNSKTKEIQYGHISVFPLRDENGEIQTVACRSTDITLVIKQKNCASRLMDASLDVFCTIDGAGKFVFVSAVSADHWGYYPEELIGKPYRDLIIEEDLEKSDLLAGEIMSGREFKSFPNRFRKKNGDVAFNLWSARWDNKTKLMYCVARDSKDKIEEEHRLRLLERVLNSTSDAILITDAQPLGEPGPKIIYVNEAFKKMSGYTAEEVIGRNPRLLQGPDSNYEELKELGQKLRRWESSEITVLNYTKTGVPFWVHFAVSPVANEKGWFTHWISVQRDVTELKKQEAEKELLIQINLSFKEEELISAANCLCENLYDFGKFDLIELWCPNMEQTQLKLIGHSTQNQDLYEFDPSQTSFQKGEGLPGQVWEKVKEIIWDITEINKYFINEKAASRLGLHALRGMPLTFNDDLVGVLLIGTRQNPDYLKQFSTVLSRLEKSIGSEINRKRLENELRNVFDAIPEIICITDLDGRFLK
ncbi:MAG: PAS domain S-box protein, partial [Phormidesmis sp. FL-bin-119]|nr:PAS domain S-box protein [Pedobacter sp.]